VPIALNDRREDIANGGLPDSVTQGGSFSNSRAGVRQLLATALARQLASVSSESCHMSQTDR
jgi:hypothetical protein